MATRTFDAKKGVISFGQVALSGFTDGDFLTIAPSDDDYRPHEGADGELSFSATNSRSHVVTLVLAQTSTANDILSGFSALDRSTPNGNGVRRFLYADTGGTTIFAGRGRITRRPDIVAGKDISTRTWTLVVAEESPSWFAGGNPAE